MNKSLKIKITLSAKKKNLLDGEFPNIFDSFPMFLTLFKYMQAIRFYSSNDVTVRDIKIINSPLCHIKFDNSKGIKVNNITISSPENSPNTDGIHLQNTQDVEIQHSDIGSGMYQCHSILFYCKFHSYLPK